MSPIPSGADWLGAHTWGPPPGDAWGRSKAPSPDLPWPGLSRPRESLEWGPGGTSRDARGYGSFKPEGIDGLAERRARTATGGRLGHGSCGYVGAPCRGSGAGSERRALAGGQRGSRPGRRPPGRVSAGLGPPLEARY
jgi:hypothetical protein